MTTRRVLVVEGTSRKAVSVVRSLGRAGFRVSLAAASRLAAARASHACARFFRIPDAERETEAFWAAISTRMRDEPPDVLLPLEAAPLAVLSRRRAELPAGCAFPFAPDSVLRRAADKSQIVKLAADLGLAVPRTALPSGREDLERAAAQVGFPMILKPREGQGSHGVRRVETIASLREWHPRVVARFGPAMLQEFIPSAGEFGVSVLMGDHSELLARFTHRRIRSYPVSGGPSTLRESNRVPEIESAAERLLAALGWSGVAMVEFRRDARDGRFTLMEVNHRFWGSLELAVVSGVDFPALLCRWALGERFEPVLSQRLGVRCRWLFPGDLLHFLSNPDRLRLDPSFFQFVAPDLHYDVASWSDPGPILLVLAETLGQAVRPSEWRKAVRRDRD